VVIEHVSRLWSSVFGVLATLLPNFRLQGPVPTMDGQKTLCAPRSRLRPDAICTKVETFERLLSTLILLMVFCAKV
jgi:hypothetical protein